MTDDATRRDLPEGGTRRVLVEGAYPEIEGGRYPVKRIEGDTVVAECDLIADGHDAIAGRVLFRRADHSAWQSAPLSAVGNDRWRATFVVSSVGRWEFIFEAWIDAFTTWRIGTEKKAAAGQDIDVELLSGAQLLEAASVRAKTGDDTILANAARIAKDTDLDVITRIDAATSESVTRAMAHAPDPTHATKSDHVLEIVVDPALARFSAWYELFPRSCGAPGRHGTFRDVATRLDYVARMGFDVLYLPPIHPIGTSFRKGPNNTLTAGPDDPGSPWAIGAREGGHKSVHPELGSLEDFRVLVEEARNRKLAIALDIAFQVSPDHPYVTEHPEWFVHRPDGTIQYAENPPKKYQDVYPFDFESKDWQALWTELRDVFLFWIREGVHVFRVDNPHTKALRFWEWCISTIKEKHPDVLFLAEAFTRPKLMYSLAKAGFSQSYTYFTWRHTKREFETYLRELSGTPVSDFYRPNFWPNTPDILPEQLQYGGRAMFLSRLLLAATLSSNYGIYGPPFELMEHVARPGAEEYVDNEKFQLRSWELGRSDSLRDVIAHVNTIRRNTPALQQTNDITFHTTSDDALLCFSKRSGQSVVLVVANLDVDVERSGTLDLNLAALGVNPDETFQVHELLSDARTHWSGQRQHVAIGPYPFPARIFAIRRRVRNEHDFEYYL